MIINKRSGLLFFIPLWLALMPARAQKAYFADGFHGGIYGHYPNGQTQFMVDMLNKYPGWKINIEIEPPTWDSVRANDPSAYRSFKQLFSDQTSHGRIEYVNPAYAQSYLWNISGESVIRQFSYGIKELKEHFPGAVFSTYSSEEPCFTSCLPQVLRSFGLRYAVLKNPDTDWGGYAAAFGGELVNWIGPDGTAIITVPRYACEDLQPGSTWQTIAWNNSEKYIRACFDYGIRHPVGMCYQDAMWSRGWGNGPWLGGTIKDHYKPSEYVTWRGYIENVAGGDPPRNWRFSQEDVHVSLVWGAQVLQKIAQQVRTAENALVMAEKMAAMARICHSSSWPRSALDQAWKALLLSQHHDCWITPYNHSWHSGKTWAAHVADWTGSARSISDSIITASARLLSGDKGSPSPVKYVRVFNGMGAERKGLVSLDLPDEWKNSKVTVSGEDHRELPALLSGNKLLFLADLPSFGYNTFKLKKGKTKARAGAHIRKQEDGTYTMETDLYRIVVDPVHGGIIKHLIAKKLGNKEFADTTGTAGFNEIKGNFYNNGGFRSSRETPATVTILENGPVRVKLQLQGRIASQPYSQTIALVQGQRVIDLRLELDWNGNPGIGEYGHAGDWKADRKGFYDDRYKLLALFPLNMAGQKVYKDAPFDVCESKLADTFFNRWDSIRNNIILHWVDVTDADGEYGMALFSDHTTSYTHGRHYPLGLDLQYSGHGLWGKDYTITGATEVHYALMPHAGKWDEAGVPAASGQWNEPLVAAFTNGKTGKDSNSFIQTDDPGIMIPAVNFHGDDLWVRLYNAAGSPGTKKISFNCDAEKISSIQLNGRVIKDLKIHTGKHGPPVVDLVMPRFGIRTIRLEGIRNYTDR